MIPVALIPKESLESALLRLKVVHVGVYWTSCSILALTARPFPTLRAAIPLAQMLRGEART